MPPEPAARSQDRFKRKGGSALSSPTPSGLSALSLRSASGPLQGKVQRVPHHGRVQAGQHERLQPHIDLLPTARRTRETALREMPRSAISLGQTACPRSLRPLSPRPHAEQVLSAKGVRPDCAACHDETSWKKSNFDLTRHAKTAFALTGAHAKLSCGKCHRAAEGETPDPAWGPAHVRLRMESKRCLDCHAPAHGKEIDPSRDCTECHGVDAWRPSRVDAKAHAALGWPLEGRHGEIQCGSCHLPRGSKNVSTGLDADLAGTKWLFTSLGRPCAECHLDPHEGRYAKSADWSAKNPCRRCHSMRTFSPSTIGVEDHAAFGFKLEGAHRTVPCFACHRELAQAPATSSLVASKASPRKLAFKDKRRACRDCHTSATLPSSGVRQ